MRKFISSQSLSLLADAEFLDLAFEPEFMRERTPFEVELLWRLAAAGGAIELERAGQQQVMNALWASGLHEE